jgi:type IX secretion system PorP/SprF family membrane protein
MKKILYFVAVLLLPLGLSAQQYPFLDSYMVNPYQLSPAYAGLGGARTLFVDHKMDWVGIESSPRTSQLSYHDRIFDKVGVGGKMIFDRTDIFKSTLVMGTYTYQVDITESHLLNFGLSVGLYGNSINLGKYYSNPDYTDDPVLSYGLERSKVKFASDFSLLYRFSGIEAGILFSNIMFGDASYTDQDLTYKPMKNYQAHLAYTYDFDENWTARPFLLLRGGQNIPALVEFAGQVIYGKRFWGNLILRSSGVYGVGIGAEVLDSFQFNYSFNFSSNVALKTFSSHQFTLGINIYSVLGMFRE